MNLWGGGGGGGDSTPRWTNRLSVAQKLGLELLLSAVNIFEVITLQGREETWYLVWHSLLVGWTQEDVIGGTCGKYEGKNQYIQGFGKKP
jgi:hypothetical protein